MSDVTCTSCVVEVLEERHTGVVQDKEGNDLWLFSPGDPFENAHDETVFVKYETREVPVKKDKVFDGTPMQAEEAGWCENEFGWVCPTCSGNDYTTADSTKNSDPSPEAKKMFSTVAKHLTKAKKNAKVKQ